MKIQLTARPTHPEGATWRTNGDRSIRLRGAVRAQLRPLPQSQGVIPAFRKHWVQTFQGTTTL